MEARSSQDLCCLTGLAVVARRFCANPLGASAREASGIDEAIKANSSGSRGGIGEPTLKPFGESRTLPFPGMTPLSEEDRYVVDQRHLYRKPSAGSGVSNEFARQVIGVGRRCKHGHPQAIMYDPLYRDGPGKKHRLGDSTRLTCPLLVSAIDGLEKKGAMDRYNERLETDPVWHGQLTRVNEAHRLLRSNLTEFRHAELAEARELYGEKTFAVAMGSGLASMRPDSKDVKCLHANTADELCRNGDNLIAQQTLRDIEALGIPVNGNDECCDNCNLDVPLERSRWRMERCKNGVGKRLSRGRKHAARSSYAGSARSSCAGSVCGDDFEDDLLM